MQDATQKVNQVLPALQISKASGGSHFIFSSFKTNIIATKWTSLKVSIERMDKSSFEYIIMEV